MVHTDFKIEGHCLAQFIEVSKTQFSGTIRFLYHAGGTITLTNKSFNKVIKSPYNLSLSKNFDLIVGELNNGQRFTILKPFLNKRKLSNGIITLVFQFRHLIVGSKFTSIDNVRTNNMTFKLLGLKQYFDNAETRSNQADRNRRIEISSSLPLDNTIKIDDKTSIHFNWQHILNIDSQQTTLKKDVTVKIQSEIRVPLSELISIAEKIEIFFSMLFYQKTFTHQLSSIFFSQNKCQIYIQEDYSELDVESFKNLDYAVPYSVISADISKILKQYFAGFESLRQVYLLVYENLGVTKKFSSNQFLNVSQAIEAFHRTRFNKPRIAKSEFNQLLKRVRNTLSEEDLSFLKSELDFANNYRFKDRLNDLRHIFKGDFLKQIGFDKSFCDLLKNTRNFYTHLSPSEKKIFKGGQLVYATIKINVTLVFFILYELGVNPSTLNHKMTRFWDRKFYFVT